MNIHEIRELGKNFCQTVGSAHYRENSIDPIEYAIANNMIEDFCLINIIKYASRFKHIRNLDDLKKVSDYSHILCGVELEKKNKVYPVLIQQKQSNHLKNSDICGDCKKEGNCDEPCEKLYKSNIPNRPEVTD